MRQRITLVHGPDDPFDPKQLRADVNALHVKSLKAAREDRLTFSLYELPQEVLMASTSAGQLLLTISAMASIKTMSRAARAMGLRQSIFPCGPFRLDCLPWAPRFLYPTKGPFCVCKEDYGHIVTFDPVILITASDLLCPLLTKSFGSGIGCTLPEHTFTALSVISERFASSSAYQYYEDTTTLNDLVVYIQQTICANNQSCRNKADALELADYFDFDYDTISQSVVVSAFWHTGASSGKWDVDIDNRNATVQTEVGIFANQKPTNPGELSLRGVLVVLGKDEKMSR